MRVWKDQCSRAKAIRGAREENADQGFGGVLFVFVFHSNEKIAGAKDREWMFTVIKCGLQGGTGLGMGLLAVEADKRNHLEQRSAKMTLSLALLSTEGRDIQWWHFYSKRWEVPPRTLIEITLSKQGVFSLRFFRDHSLSPDCKHVLPSGKWQGGSKEASMCAL